MIDDENQFFQSILKMLVFMHQANVVNIPDMLLVFPNERELAYFRRQLIMNWNVTLYGYLNLEAEFISIHGFHIKLRVKAEYPDFEIIRK